MARLSDIKTCNWCLLLTRTRGHYLDLPTLSFFTYGPGFLAQHLINTLEIENEPMAEIRIYAVSVRAHAVFYTGPSVSR